jgi:hypothetical protein
VWSWEADTALAAVAAAAIALCALGLTVGQGRREKRRDRQGSDRVDLIQPSLVNCWLEREPSTISHGYVREVLVVSNQSNQPITNIDADPGAGRSRVPWTAVAPGGKVRKTFAWQSDPTGQATPSVDERQACEVEFDAVSGKRWRRMVDGRLQYLLVTTSKDGRKWSEPSTPIVTINRSTRYATFERRSCLGPAIFLLVVLAAIGLLIYYLTQH